MPSSLLSTGSTKLDKTEKLFTQMELPFYWEKTEINDRVSSHDKFLNEMKMWQGGGK